MAKIVLNPMIQGMSGRMGNVIFRRTSKGKTSLSKVPDMSHVTASPAQQAHRERFKQAAAYAKAALADPQVRARYEAEASLCDRTAYNLALSDYFKGRNLLTPTGHSEHGQGD